MQPQNFLLIFLALCAALQSCSYLHSGSASSTNANSSSAASSSNLPNSSKTDVQTVATERTSSNPKLAQEYAQKFPLSFQLKTYQSKVLGYQHSYGVTLPSDYYQNPDRRYPVIFILHGGHGSPKDLFVKGRVVETLQTLYATDKLPPSIVIAPDGYDQRGTDVHHDPEYVDGPHGKINTAIGDELVKLVQSRYRTLPTPNFWAIDGLSSGAWGAVNIGLHHLDHFSVLASHGGYFIDKDKGGPENSPQIYITKLPPKTLQKVHIYVDAGVEDNKYFPGSLQFHQELDKLGIANQFNQFAGAHTWRYWRVHLADSLTYIGKQFELAGVTHVSMNFPSVPSKSVLPES